MLSAEVDLRLLLTANVSDRDEDLLFQQVDYHAILLEEIRLDEIHKFYLDKMGMRDALTAPSGWVDNPNYPRDPRPFRPEPR